jgi:tRNA pseudouridine38-40 synthase
MRKSELRNIKLTVEYDGSAYAGWQLQKDCLTVQGELKRAIEQIVQQTVEVQGASRTDRGVHALGQTANFHTDRDIPTRNLQLAINKYLPADIAVARIEEVGDDFDSRFSAVGKHYRYTFFLSATRSAFHARWTCRCPEELDVAAMRCAAGHLVGEKDFAPFRNRSKQEPQSTVRTVHAVKVAECAPFVTVDVVGTGFLYNMVRVIAGTLLEVGVNKLAAESIPGIFETADRRAAGPTAEAQGLCLVEVFYEEARRLQVERAVGIDRSLESGSPAPLHGPTPASWND